MRRVEIWIASDSRVYARDEQSGETFWLPEPLHEGYPPSVRHAIAAHVASVYADFMAWIIEQSAEYGDLFDDRGDIRYHDGSYPARMTYPDASAVE